MLLKMALAVFGDKIWIARYFPTSHLAHPHLLRLPLPSASQHTPIGTAIVSLAPDGGEQLRLVGYYCKKNKKKIALHGIMILQDSLVAGQVQYS